MSALDHMGVEPCAILNTDAFPNLYIKSTSTDASIPLIASAGIPVSFLQTIDTNAVKTNMGATVLLSSKLDAKSPQSLVKFLSGVEYNTMSNVLLYKLTGTSTKTYETIVDSYIDGKIVSGYASNYTTKLSDDTIKEVVESLKTAGYLLKDEELWSESAPVVQAGTENLITLLKADKEGTLTTEQKTRITLLEAKNQRFFGAFLVEYCFYRTRYEWLLKKYFDIYTMSSYLPPSAAIVGKLFTGQGTGDSQYAGNSANITQEDYLKGVTYQLACLNKKMSDMRRILGAINTNYSRLLGYLKNNLGNPKLIGSNGELKKKLIALETSSKKAREYVSAMDYSKGVMEYTSEKNRFSNILLGTYVFLNISALSIIFHLASK